MVRPPVPVVPQASRRQWLQAGAALGVAALVPRAARAQVEAFPSQPIRIIVPAQPGSALDVLMQMAAGLAKPHLERADLRIENRPGAAQQHGAETLVRLDRDERHTIAQCVPAWLREPLLRGAPYDPVADFRYIVPLAAYPVAIAVRQDSPYDSLAEAIEDAGRHPGGISYGHAGIGGAGHLLMEDIAIRHGIRWNPIAMRSGNEAARGVHNGYLDMMVDGTAWPLQVDSGAMRLLASFTPARLERYPDVPTAAELGLGRGYVSPLGLAGPRHLDPEAVGRLHVAFAAAAQEPAYAQHLADLGLAPLQLEISAFSQLMRESYAQTREMVRQLGLQPGALG